MELNVVVAQLGYAAHCAAGQQGEMQSAQQGVGRARGLWRGWWRGMAWAALLAQLVLLLGSAWQVSEAVWKGSCGCKGGAVEAASGLRGEWAGAAAALPTHPAAALLRA